MYKMTLSAEEAIVVITVTKFWHQKIKTHVIKCILANDDNVYNFIWQVKLNVQYFSTLSIICALTKYLLVHRNTCRLTSGPQ